MSVCHAVLFREPRLVYLTDSPEVQSLELGRFGSILRHHWRLASAIFALFVGAAVAYLVVTPKTYEATAVVQLNVISENPFGGDRPASALVDASTEQQVGRSSQVLTAAAQAMGESAPAVDKMRNRTTISLSPHRPLSACRSQPVRPR